MPLVVLKIALLLFGSGFCALIYQTAWLRELRLIFGASTAASAAVLAIFMGGLGLGSALLGRKADGRERPLMFYANLELGIAASAAVTPLLVDLTRSAYVALGGTVALGMFLGTVVRLALSALVLLLPTVLMGGTLPAAAKAAESHDDNARRHLSLLYACNTLGAVTGATLSTFVLLEVFGIRATLWIACLINALVALLARGLAREMPVAQAAPSTAPEAPAPTSEAPAAAPALVLAAAAVVGFAFLLMELVWYRMLAPLLGGSSYTFGLILALALLGIGLGGGLYSSFGGNRRPTLLGFALTCTLEALFIAIPFALGDRLAVLALLLHDLSALGFLGSVIAWSLVAAVVVLPASIVAGAQFPLLIALLGKGDHDVGRHVGLAYAYNTAGSIVGSLAGGFGLMPALTAPGCWRMVVALLAALGGLSALAGGMQRPARVLPTGLAAVAALWLVMQDGPSAAWRHGGVGAHRSRLSEYTLNGLMNWQHGPRRNVVWEEDGVESTVALSGTDGLAFVVNGKIDGNARGDAPTQVMGGLVGAALLAEPKTSLVVGLGTGSTAGWLGVVPSMERVDVVELEPAILDVARKCAPVNQDVMNNPKVHNFIGDAREVLLTTSRDYDIIFSEPSNPYRAGIASLFTQEFYQAVSTRLRPGGVFLQWVQAYEVDAETVRTIYATLHSVFPSVETWQTMMGTDLLLVASREPVAMDAATLRARLETEPFKSALQNAWRVRGLEGFLSHHVARPSLAAEIARQEGAWLNTDDMSPVEFGFARHVGRRHGFQMSELMKLAQERGEDRPLITGEVDWTLVAEERLGAPVVQELRPDTLEVPVALEPLAQALEHYVEEDLGRAAEAWRALPPPRTFMALAAAAESFAEVGDEAAVPLVERLREVQPTEANAVLARLRWRQGRKTEAVDLLISTLQRAHTDAWIWRPIIRRSVELASEAGREVSTTDKERARRLHALLREPFPVNAVDEHRRHRVVELAAHVEWPLCADAVGAFEPHVPWTKRFLEHRADCYRRLGHPRVRVADSELDLFLSQEPTSVRRGFPDVVPPPPAMAAPVPTTSPDGGTGPSPAP
ncbi:MAG: fused MFS/spermidine synthase [Myxococcota bacterium]